MSRAEESRRRREKGGKGVLYHQPQKRRGDIELKMPKKMGGATTYSQQGKLECRKKIEQIDKKATVAFCRGRKSQNRIIHSNSNSNSRPDQTRPVHDIMRSVEVESLYLHEPLRSFASNSTGFIIYEASLHSHRRPSSPIPGSPAPATLMFCPCMTPPPRFRLRPAASWKSGLQGGECDLWYLSPFRFLYRLPHTSQR
jgi:hypothetical protein